MSDYKTLPYSEEAERGVLGSALIDSGKVLGLCLDNQISADSFHVPAHRHLFEQLREMTRAGKAVDLLTVGEYLKQNGRLDSVGGYVFLEGLIDSTPTAAHAEYYIGFVRQKHVLRKIMELGTDLIDWCNRETDETAESILSRAQNSLFDLCSASRVEQSQTLGEAAEEVCRQWEDIAEGKTQFGLPPFLPSLKAKLGNFIQGNPYFIAAPPGGGKSVFMQNQFLFWARNKIPCAIASLEMTRSKLTARMISELSGVNSWAMFNHEYGNTDYARQKRESARLAANQLKGLPLYITDRPMDVDEFCAWGMRQVQQYNIKAIAVDYLQILNPPATLRLSGQESVKYICGKLQNFSKRTGVIMLVLSQITKLERDAQGHTRRPRQDDLYGGRIIDATSEGTLFLWQNSEGREFIDIAKNRNGGDGLTEICFDRPHNKFCEV